MKKASLIIVLIMSTIVGCTDDSESNKRKKTVAALKVLSPGHSQNYDFGDDIEVVLDVVDSEDIKDLTISLGDSIVREDLEAKSQTITIDSKNLPLGSSTIYISYNDQTGKPRKATRNIIVFSDIIPEQKIASIVSTYPHKTNAYTQGLEFYKGSLYESTGSGNMTKSFIAKVDLQSGKHIDYKALENQSYFGEGITILNDTIYQLTWESGECFVYDLEFNYIKTFYYEGEGWGLTNNGRSLIMSNGSSSIVWRNPQTFKIEKEIKAFGHEKEVAYLNELELIKGELWCNVYQTNYLIQMDTTYGKILAFIDCAGVTLDGMDSNSNVLNGIAYEANTEKIYLTGKLWPRLYEVKIE